MGLLDIFRGKMLDPASYSGVHAGGDVITTTVDSVVKWARKSSIWPMPFGTACCAIEFMALTASHYDLARFGAEVLRFSPRQADLMFVAGTIVEKEGPVLKTIYDQMPDPKWVISMGVCASSGGFYRSYHVMQGIDEIIPVDVYVPGCPPSPEALIAAVMKIQERIQKGEHAKTPQHATTMASVVEAGIPPALLEKPPARLLQQALGARLLNVAEFRGDLALTVAREAWVEAATLLRDHPELRFKLFLDLCGVDYLDTRDERYEVVLHLYSVDTRHHVRLKALLPESDASVATLTGVFRGASWFEREAWDLYGIRFQGHPRLTRLLTHDAFVGHPMRKDYPTGRRHVLKSPKAWLLEVPEGSENLVVNIGPSHPAMHGCFRVQALMDGETIVDSEAEIGYMHRNFEKMTEVRTYWQIIPYTDRLNYCSSFINGHGWALAVEKLLGIEAPPRAEAIRVILSELSRVMDHIVCIGTNVVDLGAITPFFVMFRGREMVYDLLEACCGARLTVSYVRIGGLAADVPDDFVERCQALVKALREIIDQGHRLMTRNAILIRRFRDVGVMPADEALSWGWVGPCLRGSGVPYDVRKDHPYSGYEQYDFDVPVGTVGDCYDRYLVRMEEMRQSLRIVEQAVARLPGGPVIVDDKRVALPPKTEVYSTIEALMNHFKLVYEGILAPPGEVYGYCEGANGELGYYIVSAGAKHPWRVKVRPPCYNIYQAYPDMIKGQVLADAVAIIGGLNVIAGELDR